MVIYGPSSANYDVDIGPVIVHDYYRTEYSKLVKNTVSNNVRAPMACEFCSNMQTSF